MSERPPGGPENGLRRTILGGAERPIVGWGGLALFLVGWATVSLTNSAETLFLKRVGVEQLPLVFLLNSGLLAATTYALGRHIATREHGRALSVTLWASGAFLLPVWLGLLVDLPGVLAVLVIAAKQIQALALLVFWVAMGGWVDGRQAKRLVPPMMAGGTLGVACGSLASGALGSRLGIPALVLVAAGALGLAALATHALRRRTGARLEWSRSQRRPDDPERPGFGTLWRDSSLFRPLAVGALLAGLLAPILYYQFSVAADAATRGMDGEEELLHLYGAFRGWMNLAILALQLGGTSWLFRRVGVPRAALLAPTVYVLGFLGFAATGGLAVAIAAMAAASLQDKALGEPAERTLATLFPESTRPTVAALLDGMLKRGGGALGNLIVLATIGLSAQSALPVVALPFAVLWLAAGMSLARAYPALLLDAATRTRSRQDGGIADTDLLDARTTRLLEASLLDPDAERCAAACDLAADAPPEVAAAVTASALRRAPIGNVPVLLETLTRLVETGSIRGSAAASTREALLDAATREIGLDAGVQARLVVLAAAFPRVGPFPLPQTLEDDATEPGAPAVLEFAIRFAHGPNDDDAVLADGIRSENDTLVRIAVEALRTILLITSPAETDYGERWRKQLMLLARALEHTGERAHVARALADVAARHGRKAKPVVETFTAYREDDEPAVRAALLRYLGHCGDAEHARWAISRLGSHDVDEVAAAQASLRTLGPERIDAILEAFHCDRRQTRAALLPVLRDIPVGTAALRELIDAELDGIRRVLDLEHTLTMLVPSGLVRQRLGERIDEGTRAALSLFAALLHDERIAELGPLLAGVRGGRERAVLLEALEALLPAGQATALLGLLEGPNGRGRPPASAPADRERCLREALQDEDSLTRAFVAASLGAHELEQLGGAPSFGPDEPAYPLAPIQPVGPPVTSTSEVDPTQEVAPMLSGVEIVLHLRSLSLFERLSTRELTELAGIVREVAHPAGTPIVREGDFDDCMYLIVTGRVGISKNGVPIGDLGARDFFGEMAILDGETRSATVTATGRVQLLRIDRADLLRIMDDRPGIAISICQTLSRRVRELNATLSDIRRDETSAGGLDSPTSTS